ncbi:MAG TPA: hypothetical protein VHM65_05100 [Candidatus Lustribacter sp.]|nr:hypothetical protein [Candidatus Lustribacter sp.]
MRNKTISVAEFGHTITVLAIQRNWPWPAGYEASSAALELVAVQMTWVAGTKYTAAISPDQFVLVTGATLSRPDTTINALLKARKYALLPAKVLTGKKATGWLVFKVDPKGAKALVLRYDRPKALVTSTNQTIPAKSFSVKLVG